ncbi:hypothetical protein KRP22_011062 [Phytophthora ramorum]|nr:hypothetical protein KRP22_5066 [Phytophthora ramorum]
MFFTTTRSCSTLLSSERATESASARATSRSSSLQSVAFDVRATAEATWNHFKGVEKHLINGSLYEKSEKDLDEPYTIIADFKKEVYSASSRADIKDDDAVRAFEAALSFVEQYSIDTSVFTASPSGFSPAEDIELLSPSLTPAFSAHMASPGAASDSSTASPSSPVFQLSNATAARLERGPQAAGQVSAHRKASARGRKKTAGPKKPVTRGDPNRARNERKIELAFLREKVAQLELELTALQLHPRAQTRAIRQETQKQQRETKKQGDTMSVYDPVQVPTVWKEVACRQRRRREKAERENVRLKLILDNQIKMARGLESLLQKRAKQQVVECSSLSQTNKSKYSQGRTLDFRADVNDFKDLLAHLDRAYREVDTVFASNGLATMESTHRDARMREAQAVWDHFKGAEKHRGNMYEGKVAKHLATPDTPDTIIEDFAKEFFADMAGNITASQELIENVLMDQVVQP